MSKLSDFLSKGDIEAKVSGANASQGRDNAPKHNYSNITKKVILMATLGGALTACGPSREEIDAKIAEVPQAKRDSIELAYDRALYNNIDSIEGSGKKLDYAVDKGALVTWDQTRDDMPKKKKEWSGEDFIKDDLSSKRRYESRETYTTTTLQPRIVSMGKTTTTVMTPVTTTHYRYLPEFKQQLADSIKAKQNKIMVQQKAMQNKMQNR